MSGRATALGTIQALRARTAGQLAWVAEWQSILIGAGIGFGFAAIPADLGTRDGMMTMAAGSAGALLGAAIVYNLLK